MTISENDVVQNCQPQTYAANSDALARTPPQNDSDGEHGETGVTPHSMCNAQSRVDSTVQDPGAEGEKLSRRKGRRKRREEKRLANKQKRAEEIGGVDEVFSYNNLFRAGLKCCNGVRWKQSTQNFEAHLFSRTAATHKAITNGKYKFKPYSHFELSERGKTRPIDAPHINDRQPEKVFTQEVLLPTYLPLLIYNNGASLPGKGFAFSRNELKKDLHEHFRKYGREGYILLTDGKQFFPSADHDKIAERHNELILNDDLRRFADMIIGTVPGGIGMPLGVEPSQAEMVAYAMALDNYMTCQMGFKGYGHYMDDFYVLIPPDKDGWEIFAIMEAVAAKCGIVLNRNKTRLVPLTKPFRFCKAKYILTETGKIVVRASKSSMPRNRRKLKAFKRMYDAGEMTALDVWSAVNGMIAYLKQYNEHNNILKLRRMFYGLFGFSCETYKQFTEGVMQCTTS